MANGKSNAHSKLFNGTNVARPARNTESAPRRIHEMSTESLTTVEMNTSPSSTQVQDSFLLLLLKHIVTNMVRVPHFFFSCCSSSSFMPHWIPNGFFHTHISVLFFSLPLCIYVAVCVCVRELSLSAYTCLHNRAIIFLSKSFIFAVGPTSGNEYTFPSLIISTFRHFATPLRQMANGAVSHLCRKKTFRMEFFLLLRFPIWCRQASKQIRNGYRFHTTFWIVPNLMGIELQFQF